MSVSGALAWMTPFETLSFVALAFLLAELVVVSSPKGSSDSCGKSEDDRCEFKTVC